MPLTLSVTVAVLAIVEGGRARIIGFIAIAAGLLLKGPVGLVLPVAIIAAEALASRCACPGGEPAEICFAARLKSLLWGVPLSLKLALPWFIWANAKTQGEFFRVFFWYHNVQRALGGAEALAQHSWWYYGPRLLVDALPWSVALIPAAT